MPNKKEAIVTSEDAQILKKDLSYITKLCSTIDKMYSRNEKETYHYLKKLRQIVDRFNEKYDIVATIKKSSLKVYISFYLKSESADEPFKRLKENIETLDDIFGKEDKSEASVDSEESRGYEKMTTLALKTDIRRRQVEVIYRDDNLTNTSSPEFRILFLYAMHPDCDKEKPIEAEADDIFCFDFDTDDDIDSENLIYRQKKIVGDSHY